MKVVDPRGTQWRVRRRWLPWRRRVRKLPDVPLDNIFIGGDDLFTGIVLLITIIVLVPVIVVAALILAEVLLLLLLVPVWVAVRAVRGGGWPLDIYRKKVLVGTETVHGWSASGRRLHDIADDLRSGRTVSTDRPGESPPA